LTDISENEIKGEVLYVDHYGNCQTNISPEELKERNLKIGDLVNLKIDAQELQAKWCETYQSGNVGGIGLITDSWGMVSVFLPNGNAQKLLNCKDSSKVIIAV
jgi:S-adenosylmethionine hydrolase